MKATGLIVCALVVRSTAAEYVATIPEGGVTANFTGEAAWSALKYTTP